MIFCNDNKLSDDVTFTVDTPSVAFPISNIYSNSIKGLGKFTDTVVIDMTEVVDIDTLCIVNSSNTITIEANSSDSWGAPPFTQTMTALAGTNIAIEILSATESYRYWRLTASGETTLGHCFIGTKYTFPLANNGSIPSRPTTDQTSVSTSGVGYTSKGHITRSQSFSLEWVSLLEFNSFIDMWDSSLRVKYGIFAQFEESLTYYKPYFAQLTEANFRRRESYDAHTFSMKVTERK